MGKDSRGRRFFVSGTPLFEHWSLPKKQPLARHAEVLCEIRKELNSKSATIQIVLHCIYVAIIQTVHFSEGLQPPYLFLILKNIYRLEEPSANLYCSIRDFQVHFSASF